MDNKYPLTMVLADRERRAAIATIHARAHATHALLAALLVAAVGVGLAVTVAGAHLRDLTAYLLATAVLVAVMFMAWSHARRMSNALADLDEALLKLLAVWNDSAFQQDTASQRLEGLLEESRHLVEPQGILAYLWPYPQQRWRYYIWRMTVGISTLADRLEKGSPLGFIPQLDAISGLQESVTTGFDSLREWTRDFRASSADTISNAVRSGIADSLVGRADVEFDGWQAVTIAQGQQTIGSEEDQTHVIRDSEGLRLLVAISRERLDQPDSVLVPILSHGQQTPDEIDFRVEARSSGLRPERRSATVTWRESSAPGLVSLGLIPVRGGPTDLFVSTYLANRLLQTVRLQCRVLADAVSDGDR